MIQDIIQAFCEFFLYTLDKFGVPWLGNTVRMNLAQKKTCCTPKQIVT